MQVDWRPLNVSQPSNTALQQGSAIAAEPYSAAVLLCCADGAADGGRCVVSVEPHSSIVKTLLGRIQGRKEGEKLGGRNFRFQRRETGNLQA